jgi:hypothetical protein
MADERRVKWQALKVAAGTGTDDDLNRAAIMWAQANGYVHPSQVKAPAPAPAPRQASSSGGGGVAVFPPYGRSKGMPIKGASMQDLEFYANGCRRTLADESKSRWHEKERALLAAIEEEMGQGEEEAF